MRAWSATFSLVDFQPWGTQYITAPVRKENSQISTHHSQKMGKFKAGRLYNTEVRCKHLWSLTKQWESDCVILPITCRKATEPKILAADSPMFLICSSRTGRLLHSLQTALYRLGLHGQIEICVGSVLGSAQWFCHSAGLAARVARLCISCKEKALQVGSGWEEAELWF